MSVWSNLVIYMVHYRQRSINSWCFILGFITVPNILIFDKWKWNRIITIWSEMLRLKESLLFYELKQTTAILKMHRITRTKTIVFYYFIDLLNNLKVQFYRVLKHFARTSKGRTVKDNGRNLAFKWNIHSHLYLTIWTFK